nr:alpha/beta fold hydrolase [Kiritimatiellia bacterium]
VGRNPSFHFPRRPPVDRSLYHPTRRYAPTPDQRGLEYEEVEFAATDGVRLTGWWLPAQGEAKGTILHFHGNAQNMSTHVRFAEWLPARGYHLFVFDYRGYGHSEGSPTRRGLVRDGIAALETVQQRPEFDPGRFFVWGQSLGATVALQAMLRSDVPVTAALIDSTFSSHGRIAAEKMRHLPWFLQPLRLLRPLFISGGFDADQALSQLPEDLPLFFIHGERDRVIPPSHSQRLHRLRPENSRLWIIPGAGHCDGVLRFPEQVHPRILEFLEEVLKTPFEGRGKPDPLKRLPGNV